MTITSKSKAKAGGTLTKGAKATQEELNLHSNSTTAKLKASAVIASNTVTAPPPKGQPFNEHAVPFQLCLDSLTSGCVNAFIELFELSHRPPVCVDELSNTMFTIPDDKLQWAQNLLVEGEKERRAADFQRVYDNYISIANYFEDQRDHQTAIHFHTLGLECAKQSADKELEGIANENFGFLNSRLEKTDLAIQYHETHLKLAEASKNAAAKKQANENLYGVYVKRAQESEAAFDYPTARDFYEKALQCARGVSDTATEGDAYHRLGGVCVRLGDMEKALYYQKQFLLVSQENKNVGNEGKAQISLAQLQEDMGQTEAAIQSLLRSLTIAEEKDDKVTTAQVCTKLGTLYNKQGNFIRAAHYLTKNHTVCQSLGEPKKIEAARILLGAALGNMQLSAGFMGVAVGSALDDVLRWQCFGDDMGRARLT